MLNYLRGLVLLLMLNQFGHTEWHLVFDLGIKAHIYFLFRFYKMFLFLNILAEIFFTRKFLECKCKWNFTSKNYLFLVAHNKVCGVSVNTVCKHTWFSFQGTSCALLYHLQSKITQLLFHKFLLALIRNLLLIFHGQNLQSSSSVH